MDYNEDPLFFLIVMIFVIETMKRTNNRVLVHHRRDAGSQIIHDCILRHPQNCLEILRMEKDVFIRLCDVLKSRGLLQNARQITVEEQVAIFLLTLGHDKRNRRLQYDFQHSGQTISKYVNLVLGAILSIGHEYIGCRNDDTPSKVRCDSRFFPFFKNCLGAIYGTHIPVFVRKDGQNRWRNTKGFLSQNVLAVVGFDMRFHYVIAGWEGSVTDSQVLYSALDDPNHPLQIPQGKYYLADVGYPNITGVLTPHQKFRYHLSEFNQVNAKSIDTKEELFNHRHSSLRTTCELIFGLLKARFPILKNHVSFPIDTQIKIVQASCILHNFILENNPSAEQFIPQSTEVRISQLDDDDDDDDDENTQAMSSRGSNNSLRDEITDKMWESWPNRLRR